MNILSSERKIVCENIVAALEGNLGDLEVLYPSIPAIEVTTPHVHASFKLHVSFNRKRCANKKIVV